MLPIHFSVDDFDIWDRLDGRDNETVTWRFLLEGSYNEEVSKSFFLLYGRTLYPPPLPQLLIHNCNSQEFNNLNILPKKIKISIL